MTDTSPKGICRNRKKIYMFTFNTFFSGEDSELFRFPVSVPLKFNFMVKFNYALLKPLLKKRNDNRFSSFFAVHLFN